MKKRINSILLLTAFALMTSTSVVPARAENPDDLLITSTSVVPAGAESPDDLLIVANFRVPVDTIDIKELKAIFLKKKLYWKGVKRAVPLNSKKKTLLRTEFQRRVLDIVPQQEWRYWEKQKIERALTSPPEFSNLQKAVFHVENAVSYVFRKDYLENVSKILLVIPPQ